MNKNNGNVLNVFIHKDKILKVNKKSYAIELNDSYLVLLPKSMSYEVDKLCNVIKMVIISDMQYKIDTIKIPYQRIGTTLMEMNGIDVWNELINNNEKYNRTNKSKENINYV